MSRCDVRWPLGAGMLAARRGHLSDERFGVLLGDDREREEGGDQLEPEGDEKGELERNRRRGAADCRTDGEADEVERHRNGERAPEPRWIGAPLSQGEENHV